MRELHDGAGTAGLAIFFIYPEDLDLDNLSENARDTINRGSDQINRGVEILDEALALMSAE